MARGGAREGSGRKKGIATRAIRVPSSIFDFVFLLSKEVKKNPEEYKHLFEIETAVYMTSLLSSKDPMKIGKASARLAKQKKRKR